MDRRQTRLSGLIWTQAVFKCYQQMTLSGKGLRVVKMGGGGTGGNIVRLELRIVRRLLYMVKDITNLKIQTEKSKVVHCKFYALLCQDDAVRRCKK